MPIIESAFYDRSYVDPKSLQYIEAAANNAAAVVTLPAWPVSSPHILAIVAAFSDLGATSKVLTIVQNAVTLLSLTITGGGGTSGTGLMAGFVGFTSGNPWRLVLPQFAFNQAITVTLPASGTANIIGYVGVMYRIL